MSVYDEHGARKQKVLNSLVLNRDPAITAITMTDPVYNTDEIRCMPVAVDADQEELDHTYLWEKYNQRNTAWHTRESFIGYHNRFGRR